MGLNLCGLSALRPRRRRTLAALRGSYGLFIGGSFVAGASVFKTISPATEEVLAEVTHGATEDVDRAVAAARQAYERVWSAMPGRERARYLLRDRAADAGAGGASSPSSSRSTAASRSGRPARWTSRWRPRTSSTTPAGPTSWATPGSGRRLPAARRGRPGHLLELAPADARVEDRARPGLREHRHPEAVGGDAADRARVRRDLRQADLPPGVVNVVTGDGIAGQLVAGHPGLDKVAFTGSAEVGREIAKACALSGKPLTLELGGTAVEHRLRRRGHRGGGAAGSWRASSSTRATCAAPARGCSSRRRSRDELVAAVRRRMSALRLGDPLDDSTDIGAVNSRAQLDKITELVASGEAEGALRWSPPCALPDRGFWFPPTTFTAVAEEHRIGSEELAWPVLTVSTFDSPAEAVERADGTRYGLAAGVWTRQGALSRLAGLPAAGRGGLGERVRPVRPGGAVRRLPGGRARHRGRQARPRGLSRPAGTARCLT